MFTKTAHVDPYSRDMISVFDFTNWELQTAFTQKIKNTCIILGYTVKTRCDRWYHLGVKDLPDWWHI